MHHQVLSSFLDSAREAISRNAKMFRKDDDRAENVREVGASRGLMDPCHIPLLRFTPRIAQILDSVNEFLATSVLLPSLSAASNIVQQPTSGSPPPSFYKVSIAEPITSPVPCPLSSLG
jgi:hypothetical protein